MFCRSSWIIFNSLLAALLISSTVCNDDMSYGQPQRFNSHGEAEQKHGHHYPHKDSKSFPETERNIPQAATCARDASTSTTQREKQNCPIARSELLEKVTKATPVLSEVSTPIVSTTSNTSATINQGAFGQEGGASGSDYRSTIEIESNLRHLQERMPNLLQNSNPNSDLSLPEDGNSGRLALQQDVNRSHNGSKTEETQLKCSQTKNVQYSEGVSRKLRAFSSELKHFSNRSKRKSRKLKQKLYEFRNEFLTEKLRNAEKFSAIRSEFDNRLRIQSLERDSQNLKLEAEIRKLFSVVQDIEQRFQVVHERMSKGSAPSQKETDRHRELDGLLVQEPAAKEIYLICDGCRRAIPNYATFWNLFGATAQRQIEKSLLASAVPLCSPIGFDAHLVRDARNGALFLVSQGIKRKLLNEETTLQKYQFDMEKVRIYDSYVLDTLTSGKPII